MCWFGKKRYDEAKARRQAARNLNARDIAELEAKTQELVDSLFPRAS